MTFFSWIGEHANGVASTVRAFMYMIVALNWVHLDATQIGTIFLFTETFLALFIDKNTVSKVRVGERINEGVEKELIARTGTGTFTPQQ